MTMTPLEALYTSVWLQVLIAALGISGFAGVIYFIFATALARGLGAVISAIALLVSLIASPIYAGNQGDYSTTVAWEAAKDQKATYVEKLHGVWVRYDVITHTCQYRDNDFDINDTGCEYVTRDSYCDSRDDDGDCEDTDYTFTPWFAFEETLTADLNVFKNGHVVFASHLAPENWESNLYNDGIYGFGNSLPYGAQFEYRRDLEWLRVKHALDNNLVLPGSVYNLYLNWVHADDLELRDANLHNIPRYQNLGLLPTMTHIYDSQGRGVEIDFQGNRRGNGFDYDIVQFLNMEVSTSKKKQWQETAALWAGMAGPTIEGSMMLVFAQASAVPDPHEWVATSKAWLRDENQHGRFILPKNLVLVMCGVTDDQTTIQWCRMETGMHKGNEGLIADVERLKPMPFAPDSIFGIGTKAFATNNDGTLKVTDPDGDGPRPPQREAIITYEGGHLDRLLRAPPPSGFDRVEMATQEYRRTTLQPDPEQIEAIKSETLWNALKMFGMAWVFVFVISFVVYAKIRSL